MQFHEKTLANDLKIVVESNDSVHSIAVGFFVRTGARDELPEVNGVSHFLEHMAFKGTEKFTADDVNRIFDEVGAEYNASTSEEVTIFYANILPEYLPQTFEVLAGILFPTLRQDDFDMEKNVILEEISMYQDQPMHIAYENVMLRHFSGHPLGVSILGTLESVGDLTSEQMRQYHADHYRGGNITLAVAGNIDPDVIFDLARKFCDHWPGGRHERPTPEAEPATGAISIVTKESSTQQNVVQVAPAPPAHCEMRFASELLSIILGEDGGSRIYWDIVDPGHADFADLGYYDYDGSGAYMTWLGCQPDTTTDNLNRIQDIYAEVNENGVTEVELEQAKNKIASRIVLRSERPMGRLSSLGGNWVYRQHYRSVADDLSALKSLTLDDIRETLDRYPLGASTTAAVGPLAELNL
ncbi:MAG: insulinase family protein [Planctomycetes bacterium]|nr:insulinase family protein [Planctomycetota bacterium]